MKNKHSQLSPDTIRLAVPEVSAQKVRSIMKKYRSILSAFPAAELQGAVNRTNLEKITKKLLAINSTAAGRDEINKRKNLISELEKELTFLSADLDLFDSEEAKTVFDQMGKLFKKYSINANMQDYMKTYLSLPVESRVPVCDIQDSIVKILSLAHEVSDKNILEVPSLEGTIFEQPAGKTPLLKRTELDNLFTVLGMYCWGQQEKAEKEMDGLLDRLNFYKRCDHFRTDTGLNNLTNVDINGIFTALIKIGVSKDKVDEYAIKEIKKIKTSNKKYYEILAKGMNPYELSGFLLAAIALQKESNTKKSKDALKVTFRVEAELVLMKERVRKANEKNIAKLKKTTDELNEYRNRPPRNVHIDSEIVKLENDVASYRYEIALNEYAGLFAQVQHEMANSYLSKKSVNPTSKKSKEFFERLYSMNYKDDGGISDFTDFAKGFSISVPPSTSFLVSAHLQVHTLENEWKMKKWHVSHPKYVDSLNDFYNTGKVSPKNRDVLLESLDFESKHVEETIERFMAESVDVADFYEGLRTQHANINELSPRKAKEASVRLTGYLMLLSNLRGSSSKLLGIYNSFDYLGEGLTSSKEKIAELKKRDGEYVSKIEDVANFMGKTEEISIPDLELYAESPLYRPLLQREFGPIFQNVQKQFKENVFPAQEKIAAINPQLKYWSKHPDEQMRTHGFDVADQYLGDALTWLREARNGIVGERKKLVAMLNNDGLFKNMPKAMKLLRTRLIRKAIDGLDKILDDKKSALSMLAINHLVTVRAKLKETAENVYLEGLAYGFAIAIIMVAAIGTAVAGGYAFAALGSAAFGGMTATIGSVAVADLAVGFTTMVGVSAGGVLGSRGGMSFTQWTNMADWGGYGKIWEPKRMARDFGIALALNLAAVGAAKFIVGSLKFGAGVGFSGKGISASSARFASRFPRLANISRGGLKNMKLISEIASPSGWFRGGGATTRQGVLRQFGVRIVEEGGEEAVETAAGAIHPVAGFLATVANASDGCNVDIALHGIRAADVGIVTEGKSFAYTAATAEEFVTNLEVEFSGQKGLTFETTINDDGSVTIDLMTTVTNAKGKTKSKTFSSIDVQPAQLSTNLSVDAEISRVRGVEIDENTGEYSVANSHNASSVIVEFGMRNFNIEKTKTGIRVSKHDYSLDIKMDAQILIDVRTKIQLILGKLKELVSFAKRLKRGEKPKPGELEQNQMTFGAIGGLLAVNMPTFAAGLTRGEQVAMVFQGLDILAATFAIGFGVRSIGGRAMIDLFAQFNNKGVISQTAKLRARFESIAQRGHIDDAFQLAQQNLSTMQTSIESNATHWGVRYFAIRKSFIAYKQNAKKIIKAQRNLQALRYQYTQAVADPNNAQGAIRLNSQLNVLESQMQTLFSELNVASIDLNTELGTGPRAKKPKLLGFAVMAGIGLGYLLARIIVSYPLDWFLGIKLPGINYDEDGDKKKKSDRTKAIEDPFGGGGVIEGPSETDAGAGKPSKKKIPKRKGSKGSGPTITPVTPGGGKSPKIAPTKQKRTSGSKKVGGFEDVDVDESE